MGSKQDFREAQRAIVVVVALMGLFGMAGPAALAAPTISSASGTASAGQQVIIRGSGFGAKPTPGPLVFDDFERGTNGALVAGNAPLVKNISNNFTWRDFATTSSGKPKYSNTVMRMSGAKSSYHGYGSGRGYNSSLEIIHPVQETGGEVYFSMWRYQKRTSTNWSRNVKPWIVYGNGSGGVFPSAYNGWGNPSDGDGAFRNSVQDNGGSAPSATLWGGPDVSQIDGQWIRIEGYLKQSSSSTNNGAFQVWVHRPNSISRVQSNTSYRTRTTDNYWRQWHFGSYYADDTGNAAGEVYLDEIYFDNTRARVELGNTSTWETNTHREIQIPTSWADGQVSVTINPGTFTAGQTAYLFVVDANGVASNQGYPVVIEQGGTAAISSPPNPPGSIEVR